MERTGDGLLTFRLTKIVLLDPPDDVTVIVPEFIPGARPTGLTDTDRTAGVLPADGTDIHPTLDAAEKLVETQEFETDTVCEGGLADPVWYEKDSALGLTLKTCVQTTAGDTVRVTFSESGEYPFALILIEPLYVPALSPAGETDTVNVTGFVPMAPLVGETRSQLAEDEAVNEAVDVPVT